MIVTCDFTIDDIPEEKLVKIYAHFYQQWQQEHREVAEGEQPTSQDPDAQAQDDGQG